MIAALIVASGLASTNQRWLLGSKGPIDLYVELKPDLLDETNRVRTFNVHLVFLSYRGANLVKKIDKDLGQSFGGPTTLSVGPFLSAEPREQVFISLTMGRVQSWVFDFDGNRLRTLYSRTTGRVATTIAPSDHGGWEVIELWPKSQYYDEFQIRGKARPDGWVLRRVPLKE